MEYVKDFIKPELIVLIPVIYLVGVGIKKSNKIKDEFIPLILGVCGVVLATLYVMATCDVKGYKDVLMALFTALTQGVLVAGCSVFVNQVIKQTKSVKEV